MATTIINPQPSTNVSNGSGIGFLIGAIVLVVFLALVFFYAVPFIRGLSGNGGVQVNVPVPKSINVNVQPAK